jgi:hypothetical protein
MWEEIINTVDENVVAICNHHLGNCTNIGKEAVIEAGEKIDNIFMVKSGAFGFLTEDKTSPFPWMMASCAFIPGAAPLCLTFFGTAWFECAKETVNCFGG